MSSGKLKSQTMIRHEQLCAPSPGFLTSHALRLLVATLSQHWLLFLIHWTAEKVQEANAMLKYLICCLNFQSQTLSAVGHHQANSKMSKCLLYYFNISYIHMLWAIYTTYSVHTGNARKPAVVYAVSLTQFLKRFHQFHSIGWPVNIFCHSHCRGHAVVSRSSMFRGVQFDICITISLIIQLAANRERQSLLTH